MKPNEEDCPILCITTLLTKMGNQKNWETNPHIICIALHIKEIASGATSPHIYQTENKKQKEESQQEKQSILKTKNKKKIYSTPLFIFFSFNLLNDNY